MSVGSIDSVSIRGRIFAVKNDADVSIALGGFTAEILMNGNGTGRKSLTRQPFKLDGVVQKISCPFLMLHGDGDEQIPLSEAQKCFDAVGSKQKTMKVFTREEGGYHHCQIDNQSICAAYMWDWLEQVLQPAS